MEIDFKNKKIRAMCEIQSEAEKKLGQASANKLRIRLVAIEAAKNASDLVAGSPHQLTGDFKGCLGLNLSGGSRIVIRPTQEPLPRSADGSIDWSKVNKICIEYIGDYHD